MLLQKRLDLLLDGRLQLVLIELEFEVLLEILDDVLGDVLAELFAEVVVLVEGELLTDFAAGGFGGTTCVHVSPRSSEL